MTSAVGGGAKLAVVLFCSSTVFANGARAAEAVASSPKPVTRSAAKKVLRLEAEKIEGKIQKPQAFYILQRSNLNFNALELNESFLPKILQSIEDKPF